METIEEAAIEYAKRYIIEVDSKQFKLSDLCAMFELGSNWQKGQLIDELIEAFKVEGIHYTKEFLLKLLEQNKK